MEIKHINKKREKISTKKKEKFFLVTSINKLKTKKYMNKFFSLSFFFWLFVFIKIKNLCKEHCLVKKTKKKKKINNDNDNDN